MTTKRGCACPIPFDTIDCCILLSIIMIVVWCDFLFKSYFSSFSLPILCMWTVSNNKMCYVNIHYLTIKFHNRNRTATHARLKTIVKVWCTTATYATKLSENNFCELRDNLSIQFRITKKRKLNNAFKKRLNNSIKENSCENPTKSSKNSKWATETMGKKPKSNS